MVVVPGVQGVAEHPLEGRRADVALLAELAGGPGVEVALLDRDFRVPDPAVLAHLGVVVGPSAQGEEGAPLVDGSLNPVLEVHEVGGHANLVGNLLEVDPAAVEVDALVVVRLGGEVEALERPSHPDVQIDAV